MAANGKNDTFGNLLEIMRNTEEIDVYELEEKIYKHLWEQRLDPWTGDVVNITSTSSQTETASDGSMMIDDHNTLNQMNINILRSMTSESDEQHEHADGDVGSHEKLDKPIKGNNIRGSTIKGDEWVHSNHWLCGDGSDEKLDMPIYYRSNTFDNPWDTWKYPGFSDVIKMVFMEKNQSDIPRNERVLEEHLPVQRWGHYLPSKIQSPPDDKILSTWIGHATVLVQMDGINILTDPVFSERCSILGPKRYRPPPCTIGNLPTIHAVVISNNNYYHLDVPSVKQLDMKYPEIRWYVPLKMRSFMKSCGCKHVGELTWWDEMVYDLNRAIKFVLTPAQHWCGRWPFDSMKMLWGSWYVIGPQHRFYFAGSTGYCTTFKQIGKKYGPFDLAAIPIGGYQPRWMMGPQHVNPDEAVEIHKDIKAKQSIAIHWGTFSLGNEYFLEPKTKLEKAAYCLEEPPYQVKFIIVEHGKPRAF